MTLTPLPAFSDNYIWMLHDGSQAVVVDPGDAQPVTAALQQHVDAASYTDDVVREVVSAGLLDNVRQAQAQAALTHDWPAALVPYFLKKQAEYFGNKSFNELRQLIEHDSEALREHPFEDKRAYLTFFEEVALLTNSGLINRRLAYYMFGYYATRCLESNNFWSNVNRDDIFWNVFNRFAQDMQTRLRQHHEVVAHDLQV